MPVVLSCFAAGSCEFVTRSDLTIGLFRFSRDGGECLEYSDINGFTTGWLHDWARVSALIAPLFGSLAIVLMFIDCCCNICCSKYVQTGLIVCCQLNQGFTFLIWVSDACFTRKGSESESTTLINRGCRVGDGSILSFSACMLYFIGGFFLCCSPKPDPLCFEKNDDSDGKTRCCRKDGNGKESDDAKKSNEKNSSAQEEKNQDKGPVIVTAAVKEEDKEEEVKADTEKSQHLEKATGGAKSQDKEKPDEKVVADEESLMVEDSSEQKTGQDDAESQIETKEEEKAKEAPAVIPVPVPVVPLTSQTQSREESGMEVGFDEEFGTSQVMFCCDQ